MYVINVNCTAFPNTGSQDNLISTQFQTSITKRDKHNHSGKRNSERFYVTAQKSIAHAGIDKQVPQNATRSGGIHTYRFLTNFQFLRLRFACRSIRTPSVIIIMKKAITTAACFMLILRLLRCYFTIA